jgi:hypothetical protein
MWISSHVVDEIEEETEILIRKRKILIWIFLFTGTLYSYLGIKQIKISIKHHQETNFSVKM